MSKYDFEIDMSEKTSTGMILNKIKEGSVVLEFGCATGRMTRYMKEVLGCRVYIVEYDESAYNTALQYAEDGLCDDILTFQWAEKFSGMQFDAILFVDVLEHLTAPEKVLQRAAALLKDTGSLYVSIPNITHNDILLKAVDEHFDYTRTGLLDDTHVHFWGFENVKQIAEKSGLSVRAIEATYCDTGYTEQYEHTARRENVLLENILKERRCGEVYQFVVILDKSGAPGGEYTLKAASIKSHIYLDTGRDFNAEEIIAFDAHYSGEGSYLAHFEIPGGQRIRRVRFDPIEFQSCILRHISISQGGQKLLPHYHRAVRLEEGLLLLGSDPMVYTDALPSEEPVTIDAEIILAGQKYIGIVQEACDSLAAQISQLQQDLDRKCAEVNGLTAHTEQLHRELDARRSEISGLRGQIDSLTRRQKELQSSVDSLSGENAELHRDLGSYIVLTNNKDKYALELEQELAYYRNVKLELEQAVNYYQNLKVVKLRMFAARIIKGVYRRVKRIIGK